MTFSEPVDLSDVAHNNLVYFGASPIDKCVLRGSECWQGETWMSETAAVALNVSQVPETLTLVLAGGVRGSGRTVSASRSLTNQVDPGSDGIRISLALAEFKVARGVQLWIERTPPPASTP